MSQSQTKSGPFPRTIPGFEGGFRGGWGGLLGDCIVTIMKQQLLYRSQLSHACRNNRSWCPKVPVSSWVLLEYYRMSIDIFCRVLEEPETDLQPNVGPVKQAANHDHIQSSTSYAEELGAD